MKRSSSAAFPSPSKLGEVLDIGACLSQRCRSQRARSFQPRTTGVQVMDRERLRTVRALRFGLLLPILLLVAFPAVAQAPTGKPKVDRLVMGLITPYLDYVRPWINGTADHNIQHDPMLEWLVEVDAETGQYKPWLADSWTVGPDGRSWRVKLHKGVQFHHGYGEFTAQDVVHTHALWCDPNYPGRKDLPGSGYRAGICQVQKIEVVNAHEITMHCKVVCLDMPFYYSSASNVMIFSKKQWDAEGEMGYERRPAGTGPYIFKERELVRYVHGFYPDLEGWDPSWEKRFPELYGYDPAAAKRLLTEAGYPKGFKAKAWLYPFAGAPEMIAVMEAVALQLREVGIEIELVEADWVAAVRPKLQKREASGYLWAVPPSKKAVEPQLAVFNVGKGIGHIFQTDEIYKMWEDLLQITDGKARDAQLRKIGNYKFESFETIPLFDLFIEVVVDPKIIADWPFPGWDGGDVGHTWRIMACKQNKPCK